MQIKLLRQVIRILYYDMNMDFYMFELSLISTVGIDATSPVKATFFLNGNDKKIAVGGTELSISEAG